MDGSTTTTTGLGARLSSLSYVRWAAALDYDGVLQEQVVRAGVPRPGHAETVALLAAVLRTHGMREGLGDLDSTILNFRDTILVVVRSEQQLLMALADRDGNPGMLHRELTSLAESYVGKKS